MHGRLGRFGVEVNAARGLALAICWAVGAAAPAGAVELAAGLDAGYAFRSNPDGRNHGVTADAFVDVPLPLWRGSPLGLRPEVLALGVGGSEDAPGALGLFAGALSLVYAFDDSEIQALAGLGPLAGLVVDGTATSTWAGALASIGLRFPVAAAARLEARVLVPALLLGPRGVVSPGQASYDDGAPVEMPLQAAFVLGLVVDLERVFGLAGDGVGPEGLLPAP